MDLKMVDATEDMAEQLVSFHNSHYHDNRRAEHWKWVYKRCYPDLSIFKVMTENGRIVGTQGFIPIYLRVAGERILSGKPENSLVAPEHRGGDIYNNLYTSAKFEAPQKGFQCLWGYGPLYKASIRAGYTVYKDVICSLAAAISPGAAVSDALKTKKEGLKKRIAGTVGPVLLWLYGSALRATITFPSRGYVIRSELSSQTDMDDLYRRLRERWPDMIHIDLDERYLKWRIYDNPFCTYRSYFVYRGTKMVAYSFVNAQEKTRAHLTDFTFDDINAANLLLSNITGELKAENVGTMIFMGNRENPLIKETFRFLRQWGFVRVSSTNFHTQNFQFKREELLSKVENWYMNGIGTEGSEV